MYNACLTAFMRTPSNIINAMGPNKGNNYRPSTIEDDKKTAEEKQLTKVGKRRIYFIKSK